jgi:hypothetical protein
VDLDDPNFERTPYDPLVAYGRSKTANILFAVAFDNGTGTVAYARPLCTQVVFRPNWVVTRIQAV